MSLTSEQKADVVDAVRRAVAAQLDLWHIMSEIEAVVGEELELHDYIEGLTVDVTDPLTLCESLILPFFEEGEA